jgi:hypothetical protein
MRCGSSSRAAGTGCAAHFGSGGDRTSGGGANDRSGVDFSSRPDQCTGRDFSGGRNRGSGGRNRGSASQHQTPGDRLTDDLEQC